MTAQITILPQAEHISYIHAGWNNSQANKNQNNHLPMKSIHKKHSLRPFSENQHFCGGRCLLKRLRPCGTLTWSETRHTAHDPSAQSIHIAFLRPIIRDIKMSFVRWTVANVRSVPRSKRLQESGAKSLMSRCLPIGRSERQRLCGMSQERSDSPRRREVADTATVEKVAWVGHRSACEDKVHTRGQLLIIETQKQPMPISRKRWWSRCLHNVCFSSELTW